MSSANWIGQTLGGKYQIAQQLKEDGFAVTYKAYDNNIRDAVAVKLVRPELTQDPYFPGRFAATAAAVAQLRHPNLNRLLDYAHDKGIFYVVAELREGDSLQGRLEQSAQTGQLMAFADILKVGEELSEALQFAHNNGQPHGALNPLRIQFDDERAVLMDLGMARITGAQLSAESVSRGTAPYLAPEQMDGSEGTAYSDLYALGMILYRMVAGRLPFDSLSATNIMQRGAEANGPDVRRHRRDTPLKLAALIARLLQSDPAKRVQSAATVAKALASIAGELSGGATVIQPGGDATMVQPPNDATLVEDPGATVIQPDAAATVIEQETAVPPRYDPTLVQSTAAPLVDPERTVVEDDLATSVESFAAAEPAPPAQFKPAGYDQAPATRELAQPVPPTTIEEPSFVGRPPAQAAASAPVVTSGQGAAKPKQRRTGLIVGCVGLLLVAICAAAAFALFATPAGDSLRELVLGATATVPGGVTPTAAGIAEATAVDATAIIPTEAEIAIPPTEIPATATAVPPTETTEVPTATTVPPTATDVPPTATLEPTATTAPPTATLIPPTATAAGPTVRISAIRLEGSTYIVDYTTTGYTEALPGMHVHFFFNTVPPEQAGLPGGGPWFVWGGPRPFNGYTTNDRPGSATQMCALVANPDHSIILGSGNCVNLP